jgi:undecaprenyl-diphosphatase
MSGEPERVDAAAQEAKAAHDALQRRLEVRRLRRVQGLFALGLIGFAVLALYARAYAYFSWDMRAAVALQSIEWPGWAVFMKWASVFGDGPVPFVLTGATILLFFFRGRRSEAAALLLSTGGGGIIERALKDIIARPRPSAHLANCVYETSNLSFPSGHVTFYVCYFGFLFFVAYAILPRGSTRRRLALTLTALPVLLVGPSRVYLGEHWPSDTLGAYLMSGVWVALCLDLYRRWKKPKEVMSDK